MMAVSLASFAEEKEVLSADTVMLNELIVTAMKQTATLDRLPVASTLVTRAEVERLDMKTIRNISDVVPNFYIPEYGSRITSSIYVRGLGARMDQPSVGMNVDNVPFLNKDAYDFDITDISSVEMLRGPQSTLYGRNTIGGQINITTLSPLQYEGWRIAATMGNGMDGHASAGWYHSFSHDAGLSLTAAYSHSDGWFKNEYNGEQTGKENLWNARAKYVRRFSRSMVLQNTLSAGILNQSGYPYEYVPTGKISYNDTCFYKRLTVTDGLTMKWNFDKCAIMSITSMQYLKDNMTLDQDFLPQSYFTLTQKKHELALTQEIIAKNHQTGRWQRTSGLFLFCKHLNMHAPVTFLEYGIEQLIVNHRNDANPDYPIQWSSGSFPLDTKYKLPTYGIAMYHQSDIVCGKWHLSAGVRGDFEHVAMSYRSICNTGYDIFTASYGDWIKYHDINISVPGSLSHQFFQIMPKLSIEYSLSDNAETNIYANISKGYKAGGFNTQMFSDILQQRLMNQMGIGSNYDVDEVVSYKPEKSWNYELGVHLTAMDGKLSVQGCVFYINCSDQQLTMFPDGNTTGRIMTNAGKTRNYGLELQTSLHDIAGFSFNLSYGYTNARFREFFNGIEDFKGKYLPYAPQNTLFGEVMYIIPMCGHWIDMISADTNIRATGKIYWNERNSVLQPFYALLGASITLHHKECSLRLWAENITDTKYHTFYFVSIGNEFVQRGKPFRFGATLSLNI